jgi:uncharacterized glyoxalase superfamily protein PhnB
MATKAKKKATVHKKSARLTSRPKAAVKKSAKAAAKPARKAAAPKIDPLNRSQYTSLTPNLIVSDIRRAIDFYTAALGFKVRQVVDTPEGILHAELRLRDTTLMLSPESVQQNNLSAKSIGNTPVTLYVLVENVDEVFARAVGAGGQVLMPVEDMFWGDRCGIVTDLDGNKWMLATHQSEPTEAEMAEAMRQIQQPPPRTAAAAGAGD